MRTIGSQRSKGYGRCYAAALVLAAVSFAGAFGAERGEDETCLKGHPVVGDEATSVLDGTKLRLSGGREVRLAGIAIPPEREDAAAAALAALVAGKRVALHGNGETDRYGRLVGQLAAGDDRAQWVQAALVRAGIALAAPGFGAPDCSKALLAHEERARLAKAGLWAERETSVQEAASLADLRARAGRFAVVEGVIRRVGEAGGWQFLDFGKRYREDFTVVVPREAQSAFAAAGVDLKGLIGKRVRARGVLFLWGGPAMEIRVPAALEVVGAGAA